MNNVENRRLKQSKENNKGTIPQDFEKIANELCEKALNDAKGQLHPLIRDVELDRLEKRKEFVQAFKLALEQRIAKKLALWLPTVQAVFKYEETCTRPGSRWDGSIHLLVKVPRLSDRMKALGKQLDHRLVQCLQQMGWTRFRKSKSVLEIQQVTPNEIRHAISYGAMFCAFYNAPVKVWPSLDGRDNRISR